MALYECINNGSGILDILKDGDLLWENINPTAPMANDTEIVLATPSGMVTGYIKPSYISASEHTYSLEQVYPYFAIIFNGNEIFNQMHTIITDSPSLFLSNDSIVSLAANIGDMYCRLLKPDGMGFRIAHNLILSLSSLNDDDVVNLTAENFVNNFVPCSCVTYESLDILYYNFYKSVDLRAFSDKHYYVKRSGSLYEITDETWALAFDNNFSNLNTENHFIVRKMGTDSYDTVEYGEVTQNNYTDFYMITPDALISKYNLHLAASLFATTAYRINASGSSTSYCVPYKIYGLQGNPYIE